MKIYQIVLRRRGGGGVCVYLRWLLRLRRSLGMFEAISTSWSLWDRPSQAAAALRCSVCPIFFLFWRQRKSNRPRPVRCPTHQRQKKSRRNAGRAMLKMKIRTRPHGNQYVSDKVPSLAFLFRNTFKKCDPARRKLTCNMETLTAHCKMGPNSIGIGC